MKYLIVSVFLFCAFNSMAQENKQADTQKINQSVITETVEETVEKITLAQPEQLPFEFEKVTSQKFSGGAPGSNTIVMYQISLNKLTDKKLSFSALWTNPKQSSIDFELKRKFQKDDWANYKANDNLMLFAQQTTYGEAAKAAMKKHNKPMEAGKPAPFHFTSAGLIEYELDGEVYYYEIESIEQLQSVNAP